jgi:hypothetical protein
VEKREEKMRSWKTCDVSTLVKVAASTSDSLIYNPATFALKSLDFAYLGSKKGYPRF